MAMIKREPGFLGLAKQNAKRTGKYVKKNKQTEKVTADKRGMVDEDHGFGLMTKTEMKALNYLKNRDKAQGHPSGNGPLLKKFAAKNKDPFNYVEYKGMKIPSLNAYGGVGKKEADRSVKVQQKRERDRSSLSQMKITPQKTAPKPKAKTYSFSYDKELSLMDNIGRIDVMGWLKSLGGKAPYDVRFETDPAKIQQYLRDNPEKAKDAVAKMGGPAAKAAMNSPEAAKTEAYARDRKEDYDKKVEREGKRQGFLDEYKGFQGEAAGLGKKSQDLAEGVMTDASGKVEGQEGYDATTATRQGGFAGDVKKLGGYEQGFKDIAGTSKTRGEGAETAYGGAAETGAGKLEGIGEAYKETGKTMGEAAKTGQEGFQEGAQDVGTVKDQFGKEGFQKDVRGLSEKALSGEVGQREAAMLKGRMEEQRMASQKGSEEKLRREMAQSGASPAEIAAKVAQFQRQSAAQQSQAGRSEALSSQLQGQQMGQAQLAQGAQLKGQEAGMAGKQAGLAVQQAALKGQGAAMQMQGAQGQQAALQGQGSMAQAGAGMRMQGVQGGAQLGFQGAAQQAQMLGQGMGAVQAAGGARQQQMGALDQQGGFIDQQGNFVQAQLQDTVAQETQAYSEEQARLTRKAQGTPDDPRYRPPEVTPPAPSDVATNNGALPPGTTTAPQPGGINAAPAAPVQGYSKMTRPGMAQKSIAQPGGLMAQQAQGGTAMTPELAAQEEAKRKQRLAQYSTGIPA